MRRRGSGWRSVSSKCFFNPFLSFVAHSLPFSFPYLCSFYNAPLFVLSLIIPPLSTMHVTRTHFIPPHVFFFVLVAALAFGLLFHIYICTYVLVLCLLSIVTFGLNTYCSCIHCTSNLVVLRKYLEGLI